jgi:hypothetical protein
LSTQDSDATESPTTPSPSDTSPIDYAQATATVSPPATGPSPSSDIRRLHANLETRLQLFWSTALTARTVRIHILASPPAQEGQEDQQHPPLASADVQTDANGYFSTKLTVHWEEVCRHPGAVHIATGDAGVEHDILIVAEMLPPPSPPTSAQPSLSPGFLHPNTTISPTTTSALFIPLTHSPLRVISDIDDTIKFSNIPSGARAVFKNVFVKELNETTIPGMGEWYSDMWRRGVRFHYVVSLSCGNKFQG